MSDRNTKVMKLAYVIVMLLLISSVTIMATDTVQAKIKTVNAGKTRSKSGKIKPGITYRVKLKNSGKQPDSVGGLTIIVPETGYYSFEISNVRDMVLNGVNDYSFVNMILQSGANLQKSKKNMHYMTPFISVTNGKGVKSRFNQWIYVGTKKYCKSKYNKELEKDRRMYPQAKGKVFLLGGQGFVLRTTGYSSSMKGVEYRLIVKKVG